jgi:multidrug transporter EmrE-like cation transporter
MTVSAAYAAVLLWNALLKNSGDRVLMLASIRLVGLAAGIVTAAIVPLPSPQALPYLLGAAALHYAYFALMIASYRVGDMNQVYPIARGIAPLLVLLPGAVLAGEVFGAVPMLAVCLLSAGVLLLASGAKAANRKAIMLAVCRPGGYAIALAAMSISPIAQVVALRETSVVSPHASARSSLANNSAPGASRYR